MGAALLLGIAGICVLGVLLLIGLLVLFRSYRIASPSEALIITGKGSSPEDAAAGGRVVIGGRAVVYPIVQKAFVLSLSSRQIAVEIDGYSQNGIALRLRGVAQVKVGGTVEDVRKASQRFLDQQDQIDNYCQEILSGTLRAVVGTLTVEQIIQDRASFAAQVAKTAAIAEANANREAPVETARQNEQTQKQQADTDRAIAEQQQALAIRRAELKEEADVRQAVADNAGPLSAAAERRKLLEVEQEAAKKQVELRAAADLYRRQSAAEALRIEGEAEASALEKKAAAYRQYNDAAVLSEVLGTLPDLAGKLVEPYGNIKDLSIVSTDGESKLAKSMSSNFASTLEVLRGTTGVDLAEMVKAATGKSEDKS